MDHQRYLCLVFAMLSRLFIAALWSPEGKGLGQPWLLFNLILLLSHLVSWDRCTQVNRMCRSRRVLATGGKQTEYGWTGSVFIHFYFL